MRIGEVAEVTGTTTKTLRFYEEQGLVPPVGRTAAGYREYPDSVIGRLDFIRRGRAAGLTLAQIRSILDIRDRGQTPCEHVADLLAERLRDLDAQISALGALRATIAGLEFAAADGDPETCPADQVCRYL